MSLVVTEKELESRGAALLPGEQILAAGLFQPYGSGLMMGEGVGAGSAVAHAAHLPGVAGVLISAAAGMAAQRGLATAEHQPPWTVLFATPDTLFAFDASAAGGATATKKFDGPPYAQWDRHTIAVHTSRYVTSFTLTIDDPTSGQSWDFKGNEIYKVGGKLLAHLLAEPTA